MTSFINKCRVRCFYLKQGHGTPEKPMFSAVVNSSALPLKSRINFPVLTSKIFKTTFYKIKNISQKSTKNKLMTVSYMCVSRIAGFMAAVCYQKPFTRRKVNKFNLLQTTVSYNKYWSNAENLE
jgi:hypothetical protein